MLARSSSLITVSVIAGRRYDGVTAVERRLRNQRAQTGRRLMTGSSNGSVTMVTPTAQLGDRRVDVRDVEAEVVIATKSQAVA